MILLRIISMVFTPFYLPMLGLDSAFLVQLSQHLPFFYKLEVLHLSYLFTILMSDLVLIHMYRRYQGWNLIELVTASGVWCPH